MATFKLVKVCVLVYPTPLESRCHKYIEMLYSRIIGSKRTCTLHLKRGHLIYRMEHSEKLFVLHSIMQEWEDLDLVASTGR